MKKQGQTRKHQEKHRNPEPRFLFANLLLLERIVSQQKIVKEAMTATNPEVVAFVRKAIFGKK